MTLDLTVTDLFCGAGGASIGLVAAGATVSHAANHWARACETYNSNHPDTRVLCADVSQTDPRRFPSTDVLWASPECTTFSQAGPRRAQPDLFNPDGDPAVERSRVTMWDVVRFSELHRYRLVIVENVVDVGRWPLIDVWFSAMAKLGYRWRVLSINSFVAHPTPQSRDRWYTVFSLTGNPAPDLEIRPLCWCPDCGNAEGVQTWKRPDARWGKYRQQYTYTCARCRKQALPYVWPAASAIDWSLPCPRLGDRDRPLAPATIARIKAGLERYGPSVVQAAGHTYERPGYYRTWPMWGPLPTQAGTLQHGFALSAAHTGSDRQYDQSRIRDFREPLFAQTASNGAALVVPAGGSRGAQRARLADEPHRTQTVVASSINQSLVELPFITELRGGRSDARSTAEPLATVCASGNHHGLTVPPGVLVRMNGDEADASSMAQPFEAPAGTVTGADGLVGVPFLTSYYGKGGNAPVDGTVPTVTGTDRHALVEPVAIEVEDCGFRMLEPHEAGAAMAFPVDYEVGGSKRDRVRQYGQAVTPPVAALILDRAIGSLA